MKNVTTVLFQFHYGTIKRKRHRITRIMQPLFQFHYGTIKRKWFRSVARVDSQCFNSTMVRLKATMLTNKKQTTMFQFHYGTIKRLGEI